MRDRNPRKCNCPWVSFTHMATDLSEMIAELCPAGGDCADIEVKSAAGGSPSR